MGTVGEFVCASMSDYLIVAKGGLRTAFSIHARFLTDESLFRFSIRWNGAPMLSQPYVPDWSTAPKSHYVAPGARAQPVNDLARPRRLFRVPSPTKGLAPPGAGPGTRPEAPRAGMGGWAQGPCTAPASAGSA